MADKVNIQKCKKCAYGYLFIKDGFVECRANKHDYRIQQGKYIVVGKCKFIPERRSR